MCTSADKQTPTPPPPPPALGTGMAQQSRLAIQGRKHQIDMAIRQAGG